jgi:hypothetical protein|tara:strand:- start:167 stop:298 length:132 start_codon:yes stop_codon:yes gene_type:complete
MKLLTKKEYDKLSDLKKSEYQCNLALRRMFETNSDLQGLLKKK